MKTLRQIKYGGLFTYMAHDCGNVRMSIWLLCATVDGFITNVEHVLSMIPTDIKIIPGHGPLANKADLAAAIAVVKSSSASVRAGLNSGTSAEDIAAQLEADYPTWGKGFISAARWVDIIVADANR